MSEKRRKNHKQRFDVAKKLPISEFWNVVENIYKSRDKFFSLEDVAKLTYRDVEELQGDLDITTRHHVFITVQYTVKTDTKKRRRYPTKNIQDRKGSIMSSLREQHERITGENLDQHYWESFAEEKMRLEKSTGIRHTARRKDTALGLDLENIYLKEVKKGARKFVTDFRPNVEPET